MNISKYKALLTAVDMGSLSGAAQKLGYTQSGLTHMMNAIEDEFGFSVLNENTFHYAYGHYYIMLTLYAHLPICRITNDYS